MFRRLSYLALALAAFVWSQSDWNQPFPPHRIADHLYYVGSQGLSSYLITTDKGNILINSSFERTVPLIRASIEKLGFKFSDTRILLTSHAHADHVSGNALIKELTGAKVYVMAGDEGVVANGGRGQYLYQETWKPCPVDRVLHDGDLVTLGGIKLKAHLTPGHTRGCTTWTLDVTDRGRMYHAVIVGSPNVNTGFQLVNNREYPEISSDYAKTFRVLKSLPCDIFLGAHGVYYGMQAKYARLLQNPNTNPFIDPAGYRAYVEEREAAYLRTLQQQQRH